MRNFTIYLVLLSCLIASKMMSQKSFEQQAKSIGESIEMITREEKALLKSNVEEVNVALEKNQITKEAADKQKLELATTTANNIEKRIAIEQAKLNQLVQDKVNGKIKNRNDFISIEINIPKNDSLKKFKGESRSTSQFVFAAGLNNVVTNGNTNNSNFRYWGSHFYELGFTSNYRLLKNKNLLHLKYGLSVMYNNLRPTNNRVFEVVGSTTPLVQNSTDLSDSRFKNVYLVLPVHLEFDLSPEKSHSGKAYFKSHKNVRLGLGGYAGINLKSKQYLESDINNYNTESVIDGDFNTTNFVYGLSTYIGYRETSIYLKYDLNPLFTSNLVKQNNMSLGVRFDFN